MVIVTETNNPEMEYERVYERSTQWEIIVKLQLPL